MIAERAGKSDQVSFFRAAVEEETKAAEEIAALIEPVAKSYLDLTLSGGKADSCRPLWGRPTAGHLFILSRLAEAAD